MAQANPLLEEDDFDENAAYVAFFQENRSFLRRVFLHQVRNRLKYEIGELFERSSIYNSEWQEVVEELGIDHITVGGIERQSKSSGDPALYVALSRHLLSGASLGDVIEIFIQKKKYNLLRLLKPFVEGMLLRRDNGDRIIYEPRATAPNFSFLEDYNSEVNSFRNEENHDMKCEQLNSHEIIEPPELKPSITVNHLQNSEIISSSKMKQLPQVSSIQRVDVSSALHNISVFIMHAMADEVYAKKLASFLLKNNIQVFISASIQNLLRVNHTKVVRGIYEKVDFIMPVVSKCLIDQVKFKGCNGLQISDLESAANSLMYNLLLNEFSSNDSENRRVIPVCISSEGRYAAYRDPILSWSIPFKKKEDIMKIFKDYKKPT